MRIDHTQEQLMSTQAQGTSPFDRIWRGSGIAFVVTFLVSYLIHGGQPPADASAATLRAFYDGDRTRILIGTALLGLSLLNLLWFAAALSSSLRDAGQGIWAAAATASSTALGVLIFVWAALGGALSHSITKAGDAAVTSALNGVARATLVLACFPAAMLVMAGTFGLWQARMFGTGPFSVGVAAVVLLVLGGSTWAGDGVWSPDGAYARVAVPIITLVWIAVVSGFLYRQSTADQPNQPALMPAG
jgi:hypothetical protein